MNKLYFKDREVESLRFGDKEVVALYQGDQLIWESSKPYLELEKEQIFIFNLTADNSILSNVSWNTY